MSGDIESYRPSNGTEGECFVAAFCERCHHDADRDNPCMILTNAFAYDEDDPEYPKEWVEGGGAGPRCTAFRPLDGPPPRQSDAPGQLTMFSKGGSA